MSTTSIPGYTYGTSEVATSPLTLQDLELLKQTVLFGTYDQQWLNYQQEIGLRHERAKKNKTDGVGSVPIIDYRYIAALIYPITATMKPFLAKKGHSAEEVEKMHQAWFKAVVLSVVLWS